VRIPVIGIGGIMTAGDALEFLLAGAAAVQLGTVNYIRPQVTLEVQDGIADYLQENGFHDLRALPIRSTSVLTHA
jgi:dihydroorotate dehydrogenase (NAD+) catalytic subunit